MRRRRKLIAFCAASALFAACDASTPADPSALTDSSSDGAISGLPGSRSRERGRTRPEKVQVTNAARTEEDRRRVDRAVQDLRLLGFWPRLTKHVVAVTISTRPGEASIPKDGHLADAQRYVRSKPTLDWACHVRIYSQALADDVDRQGVYYSEGRLASPPPTVRQFWAVIVAHEVGHCSPRGQRGEAYSTLWEERVLDAFGRGRLGSP